MSQMLKSSGAMAAATLASRLLGLVREMVYGAFMGNSPVASAFKMAFQIPNLFRRLLGEGALTAAFIPIFKHKEVEEGEAEMWRTANAVISGLLVSAAAITLVGILAISLVLALGGLVTDPHTRLMLDLLRWMFPYMLLVCLAAALIGMANARGHFFIPALGAAILNIVMIASVLFLAPHLGPTKDQQIFGLAIGVVVAGVAQVLFQLPSLYREGFRYRWVTPWHDPSVRTVVRRMLPGSIGVAAFQINVLIISCMSFWFDQTILATFDYAVKLMELPQGMFGISLATYLLPTLTGLASKKDYAGFRLTLSQGLSYLTFANLLAASIALGLAVPIVRLLFERGAFNGEVTQRVAMALACLAPGLLMFSMNNILARAFYALHDIKTPMKISLICLGLNLVFSLYLVQRYRESGLAVANTLSATINVGLLVYALRRKLTRLGLKELGRTLLVLVPLAVVTGIFAFQLGQIWENHLGHRNLLLKLGAVFVPGGIATGGYWLAAILLKVPAASETSDMLIARFRGRRKH